MTEKIVENINLDSEEELPSQVCENCGNNEFNLRFKGLNISIYCKECGLIIKGNLESLDNVEKILKGKIMIAKGE